MGFIDKLKGYDRDTISDKVLKNFRKIKDKPDFDPVLVKKSSEPCKSLCEWCIAIDKYSYVFKEVRPKI